MGYQRCSVASDKGQFAVRGGIIDIFPVSSPDPYRLEFWENDLESLRIFDPIGQKSVKQAENVEITPAQEMELLGKATTLGTILDYLGPNTIIVYDDLLSLEDRYSTLVSMAGMASKLFCSIEDFLNNVSGLQQIFWTQQAIEELSEVHFSKKSKSNFYSESAPMQEIEFQMFNREFKVKRWVDSFTTIGQFLFPEGPDSNLLTGQEIMEGLGKLRQTDVQLFILCNNELDETNFRKKLSDAGIILPKHTSFKSGYLSTGMVLEDLSLVLFPLTEVTKRYKIRRQKQRSTYHTSPANSNARHNHRIYS